MKLSTRGRYGLRAMVDLAANSGEEAVCIQSIADRQKISESYLEQLVRLLRKAGLVQSVRGAKGGYRLARPAETISVGDVLRALEGDLDAVNCQAFQKEHPCQGADHCVTKYVWKKINDAIGQAVDSIRLSELAEESLKLQEQGGREIEKVCKN